MKLKTKKLLLITTILIGILLLGSMVANAKTVDSGTCGDNLTWTLDDAGTLTISGTGETTYGSPWSEYENSIKSVVIEEGVTGIGGMAFANCTNLTSITISESVISIGKSAFDSCTNLTSVTIPDSVTVIGESAFYGCSSLENINLPDSITSIGGWAFDNTAFYNDNNNWDNGSLYISNYLIYVDSNKAGDYTIKPGTKFIADYALCDCWDITSVTIPNSITSIGNYAFSNCNSLTDIYYYGSRDEWSNITIGDYNEPLTNATIHYNANSVLSNAQVTKTAENSYTYSFNMNVYEPAAGAFIVALYNGNKLVGVTTEDLSVANTTYTASNKPITTSGEATSYKIFFWSSIDGMVPLCDSIGGAIE